MSKNYTKHISFNKDESKLFVEESKYISRVDGEVKINPDFFSDAKKVKDKWRFSLVCENDNWELKIPDGGMLNGFCGGNNDIDIDPNGNNIIVLLESPHKSEYGEKFTPIGPAIGTTGRNFFTYFCKYSLVLLQNLGQAWILSKSIISVL